MRCVRVRRECLCVAWGLMWLVLFPAAYVETEEVEDHNDGESEHGGCERGR